MHKDRLEELTNELLDELQQGGETAREHLYELHEPVRYVRGTSGDLMIPVDESRLPWQQQHPKLGESLGN